MNYIGNNISRRIKGMGFFGDYILAKRLHPNFPCNFYFGNDCSVKAVINRSIRWSLTPQGHDFWLNIYNKFL